MTSGLDAPTRVLLVRHGATEWSRNGRHTGRTDLPLDQGGRVQAAVVGQRLAAWSFAEVWSSPLRRARETCQLAGLGEQCQVVDDLAEWDYGDYEGLTTAEIRRHQPGWTVFSDGCPGGESPEQVGARADRVLGRLGARPGESGDALGQRVAVLFAHGHFLRVLAARWLLLSPSEGRHFALDAGHLSELGFERDVPVLSTWNS